jgi:hypothetical protein
VGWSWPDRTKGWGRAKQRRLAFPIMEAREGEPSTGAPQPSSGVADLAATGEPAMGQRC